jgi:Tfp pilus tip-associated adhesin PilY1
VSYSIKYGWYIDLPISKERVVVDPVALGDLVFFNSLIPSDALCDFGGSGWLMGISSLDGGPPPLNAVDINNDNMFDDADQHDGENVGGVEVDGLPTAPVFGLGPGGVSRWVIDSEDNLTIDSVQPEASTPSSRTSWTTIDL